ncbi:RHS repeat domain-containing protein [Methylomagnum ishizawai]|nr:RHS repeat domain-containing protein [Methylomagnum ishizawai]
MAEQSYPTDTEVFLVLRNQEADIFGWGCYNPSDCSPCGTYILSETSPPQHGSIRSEVESYVAPSGHYCAGFTFPVTRAYYTWTDGSKAPSVDFFALNWSIPGVPEVDENGNYLALLVPPLKNLGECCPAEGNPLNPGTGNKFQVETDYVGAAHTQLEFQRYYNSQDGGNWHSTYHRNLTPPAAVGDNVQIIRADGRVDTFAPVAGAWQADPDVTSRLAAVTDGGGTQTGWKLTLDDDSIERYALDGRLNSITTRAGLVTTLSYNANNQLTQVTGPFGHTLVFAYDPYGTLVKMTTPDGKDYLYTYDGYNNLAAVTYPDGTARSYQYEHATFHNALTGITDGNGQRYATFGYDDQGRAISSVHAGGADSTTLAFNANGTTTVTDARNNTHSYTFSTQFDLVKPTGLTGTPVPNMGGKSISYDANGFVASRTDFRNIRTTYKHNTRGLETSRTEAVGKPEARTITTAWHPTLHLPTQINEPGRVTAFTYDAKGNLTRLTVTAGALVQTWNYGYNGKGQVTQIDGPRTDAADITQYAYDAQGNLTAITDALGHITSIPSHDANGRPLSLVNPNGLTTTLAYDAHGRLLSSTVGGETTAYTYDNAGQLLKITRPDGSYLSYQYDAAHRLTQVGDSAGNTTTYTLDASGNPTKVVVGGTGAGFTRTLAYDALDRLIKMVGAQGQTTKYTYDGNGNLTGITDPLLNATGLAYDALNRLVSNTDPAGNPTQYQYDANDNLTQVIDPRNLATQYGYDGLGRRLQTLSPDTGNTQNSYDAAGNLLASTDARGKTAHYTYDALNRLTGIDYGSGTPTVLTYDGGGNGIGHLTRIADDTGSTDWTYDAHGRVLTRTQAIGTVVRQTAYAYDAYGRVSQITYPSGKKIALGYDGAGRIAQLKLGATTLVQNIQYTAFGAVGGWTWGNGQTYQRAFDADGRPAQYPLGGRTRSLAYDKAGRITDYADTDPTLSQRFGYDKLDRLVSAALNPTAALGSGQVLTGYGYDADGNRLSEQVQAGSTLSTGYGYDPASNRLAQVTPPGQAPLAYAYDAAGNTLGDGANTFLYNDRGRLVQANTTKYLVNGLGQRVKKSGPLGTSLFAYDGDGRLVGEYASAGGQPREVVYLGDIPVAYLSLTSVYYIHSDHLNAPRALVDATNKTVWRWDAGPFGAELPDEDPDGNGTKVAFNWRLPGQYYDAETGLHYNYARDYDPGTGRYVESDPIGLKGGINTYGYVGNNPVGLVDPSGLDGTGPWTGFGSDILVPGNLKALVEGALVGAIVESAAIAAGELGATEAAGTIIFRVQGGILPNASKVRFAVDEAGKLSIQGSDMLFINVGQKARALEFLAKRGDQAYLIQCKVRQKFIDKLRASAVDQRVGRQSPGAPQRVDATRAADQYGIPSNMFEELLDNIISGTIKVTIQ